MSVINEKEKKAELVRRLAVVATDHSIDKFEHSFEFEDNNGVITKQDIIVTLLELPPILKGLKFRYYKKTKVKSLFLSFWHNGKSLKLPIGHFQKGIFGLKEVEEYLKPIVNKCKTKGVWSIDPRKHLAQELIKKKRREEKSIERSKKKKADKIVNDMIELACAENFPKTKQDGTVSASSLRVFCLYLIGYNKRTDHLIFTEDDEGYGLIRFKPEGPQSFPELFKKYPPGVGVIAYDPHNNPNKERSVYDSPDFANKKIRELLPGDVEEYVNRGQRSYGYKNNLLDTLSHLWSFARYHQSKPLGKNPSFNPCRRRDGGITIKRNKKSKFKGSKYNKIIFTPDQLILIENKLWDLVDRFCWRALALLFIMFTGKRIEETLKIKISDIDWDNEEVNIRLTKMRNPEKVDFDPDIIKILNKSEELKKDKFGNLISINSLKWLFPSPRIDPRKLHDDAYVRSDQTRLKRLDTCMRVVKEELGFPGSMKTFRKAFDTGAIHKAKLSAEELSAVSGQSPQTIHKSYDHPDKETRKEIKRKIRLKVFNKV